MDKRQTIILASAGALLLLLGLAVGQTMDKGFGAFAAPGFNVIDTVTHTATTTHTQYPVKLLSSNTSRIYALLENDSDTDLYVYFGNFDDPDAASTTVGVNTGIRINSNGGSYEIVPENIYSGEVWATSTAASKSILVTEK